METALHVLGYSLVAFLCLAGALLSCLSISGTWLVVLATIIAAFLSGNGFPGFWTPAIMAFVSALVEIAEFLASSRGIQKRGGSGWAGLAALAGGIAGLFLGTFIPVPLVGNLIGMLAGSFACAYAVERYRLEHHGQAMHIAFGAVMARLLILLLKIGVTLGMIGWLAIGLLAGAG
ncbi:MAG: DUF456 domain-containing protein [bacterium]